MSTFDEAILPLTVFLPFAAVLILVFWPREQARAMQWFSLAVAGVTLLFSLYIFIGYDHGFLNPDGRYQFLQRWEWLPSLGITFHLGVDGISSAMFLMTAIVFVAAVLMTWTTTDRVKDYLVLLNTLVGGVYGTFAAVDLFFLFLFYEVAVLPMFILIARWGSSTRFPTFNRPKEYGAMKLVIYLVAGSIAVWVAILALFVQAGGGSFDLLDLQQHAFGLTFQRVFFPFLMVGFGVLAGLWPLHTWSPDGHVAAPTSVSMVHAGVLMKLGAYGIIRVGVELLPEGAEAWAPVLIGLGTVNVVYGAMSAFSQNDLKYVVGYSSVSHMGYVLLGIGTLSALGMTGAVLQMFSHGVMTAMFFALVGFIYETSHTRDIGALSGLAKAMPRSAFFFAIAGLTSLGLPGLSGFVAELLVFLALFQTYPAIGVLAVVGAAITAAYILRLMAKVFFGEIDPRWAGLPDLSRVHVVTGGVLGLTILVIGLSPFYFIRVIESGVEMIAAVAS